MKYKRIPRKTKKELGWLYPIFIDLIRKGEINSYREFKREVNDMILEITRLHNELNQILNEEPLFVRTLLDIAGGCTPCEALTNNYVPLDEISSVCGLPPSAFGKQEPLIKK